MELTPEQQAKADKADGNGNQIGLPIYHRGAKAGVPEGHQQVPLHELNKASIASIRPASRTQGTPVAQFAPTNENLSPGDDGLLGKANDDAAKAEAERLAADKANQQQSGGDPHAKADSVETVVPPGANDDAPASAPAAGGAPGTPGNTAPPVWGAPGAGSQGG